MEGGRKEKMKKGRAPKGGARVRQVGYNSNWRKGNEMKVYCAAHCPCVRACVRAIWDMGYGSE